jgi:hypothetical protein
MRSSWAVEWIAAMSTPLSSAGPTRSVASRRRSFASSCGATDSCTRRPPLTRRHGPGRPRTTSLLPSELGSLGPKPLGPSGVPGAGRAGGAGGGLDEEAGARAADLPLVEPNRVHASLRPATQRASARAPAQARDGRCGARRAARPRDRTCLQRGFACKAEDEGAAAPRCTRRGRRRRRPPWPTCRRAPS